MSDEITVDSLFGGEEQTSEQSTTDQSTQQSTATDPMAAFRNADGAVDTDKLFQSFQETQRSFSEKSQRLAELERANGGNIPEHAKAYYEQYDYSGLKQKAPNSFQGSDSDIAAYQKLMESMHANGVPVEKAHAIGEAFLEKVNDLVPAPVEASAARQQAISSLPNGKLMASDVHQYLKAQEAHEPFTPGQMDEINAMTQSPEGLSLLWRLSRAKGSTALPNIPSQLSGMDIEDRKEKLLNRLGTLDDAEFARNKKSILAEWEQLNA